MSRGAELRLVLAAGLLLVWADHARAQPAPAPRPKSGKQEESRRKLLEQVGLDKQPGTPAKPSEPPPEPPQEPAPAPTPPAGGPQAPAADAPAAPAVVPFTGRVHQALLASCRSCHAAGGLAAATRLVLDGNAARDHAAARKLVDAAAPRRSLLLTKATGNQHGGGPTLTTSSDTYRRLLQWIGSGALLDARPAGESPTPPAAAAGTTGPARPRVRVPSATPPVPTPPVPAAPEAPAAAAEVAAPATAAGATTAPIPAAAALAPEAIALHPELGRACQPCHRAGGPAGMTRYKLGGSLEADLGASRAFVDTANPTASPLVTKAAGQPHGGGAIWGPGSPGQKVLLAWIAAGAPDRPAPVAAAPTADGAAPTPATPAVAQTATAPAPAATPSPAAGPPHPPRASLTLFGNQLTLNGRFDLNLERRAFEANPWADGSKRALQSYHHFLFLGRQAADDPFVFTAEILSLEFYEAGFRLGRGRHWGAHVRAGKLLMPFGNEPLFHQSYGGSAGFDQRVLPAIWAAEGLAASGHLQLSGATLSADVYGVRGYALRRADAVLNLQSDLSPADDVRPALGARLGAAFGALTGFYSAYFNPLGFDRRLFLQAIDLSVWRWREIPVLDRLVLAMGLLRADVSGGGAGADYYHFASYWMARVYAVEWLYLQYRQGLRTFDNKRNLTYDARRAGREDGSTHNFTLGTRYRGLTAGLSYFLNLEKADEVDDDLLRLWVAFEF